MGAAVIGFVVVVIMLLLLGLMAALLAEGWQRLTTPESPAEDEGRVEMTERGSGRAPLLDLERERPGSTLRRFLGRSSEQGTQNYETPSKRAKSMHLLMGTERSPCRSCRKTSPK